MNAGRFCPCVSGYKLSSLFVALAKAAEVNRWVVKQDFLNIFNTSVVIDITLNEILKDIN
jgi:hypothetical protein